MRAAPPVALEVPRHGAWAAGCAVLSGIAAATLAVWTLQWRQSPVAAPLGAMAFVLAVVAAMRWRMSDGGRLQWTGGQWQLDGVAGDLRVVFDLGSWMLLRFDGERRAWLAVAARDAGTAWHGLRTAAHSPRPVDLVDADSPVTRARAE